MWTPATRRQRNREGLRFETDLTDREWELVAPMTLRRCGGAPARTADTGDLGCDLLRHAWRHLTVAATIASATASLYATAVMILVRRIARRS